jgi:microcystin-dependent protein
VKLSKLGIRRRLRAAFFMPVLCVAALAAFLSIYPPSTGHAQFADQSTAAVGGTSTGSANAYAITINNYSKHLALVPLRFIPNFTTTGPATINVSGLGNVAILRPSSIGLVALSGQEMLIGEPTSVEFNGASYVLSSNVDMTSIGKTVEFRGSVTPRGALIEDGSCVLRTTYAPLFSVIGTTYGACDGSTTFAVPDSRGTMFAALDGQGVNGLANRITAASCAAPNAVGICGRDTQTLIASQLPANIPYNDPGHSHVTTLTAFVNPNVAPAGLVGGQVSGQGFSFSSSSSTTNITINPNGGAAHPILGPVSLGRRAIKY